MATTFNGALLILPDGETLDATLRFDAQRILAIGGAAQRGDHVHDLHGFAVYPGLVNAHDHLTRNHYPRSKFRAVYGNAADWAADFTPRLDAEPYRTLRALPLDIQCGIGIMKNLRCGVTTVAHHDPLYAPLRSARLPLRVLQRYGWAHSLEGGDSVATYRRKPRGATWFIHAAEGTDERARADLAALDARGVLAPDSALIHGVGFTPEDTARALERGVALFACPSSNHYLLSRTADMQPFARARRLALGSDSLLTADGDLLDELRAAEQTAQLAPLDLFRAVTTDAASIIGLPRAGALRVGGLPDFFITPRTSQIEQDPARALCNLHPADICGVWVRGTPVIG